MSIFPILVYCVVLQYYNSIINDNLISITKITPVNCSLLKPFNSLIFTHDTNTYKTSDYILGRYTLIRSINHCIGLIKRL